MTSIGSIFRSCSVGSSMGGTDTPWPPRTASAPPSARAPSAPSRAAAAGTHLRAEQGSYRAPRIYPLSQRLPLPNILWDTISIWRLLHEIQASPQEKPVHASFPPSTASARKSRMSNPSAKQKLLRYTYNSIQPLSIIRNKVVVVTIKSN